MYVTLEVVLHSPCPLNNKQISSTVALAFTSNTSEGPNVCDIGISSTQPMPSRRGR
jgi:hypothetical protein